MIVAADETVRFGRPPKRPEERRQAHSISFYPRELEWLRAEAGRRGVSISAVVRELIAPHMGEGDNG